MGAENDGFAWSGLVVYFAVMGFVIKGVRIPLPLKLSVMIINVAASLRLIDPPDRAPSVPAAKAPSPPPEGSAQSPSSSRQAIRSRSESTIGFERSKEPIDAAALAETKDEERLHLVVDLRTAPLIGVLLLLATTTIDGSVLRQGLGDETAKPYDVLVLFISLAYISTALDSTGGLRALAFYISQRSARTPKTSAPSADKTASGLRLFSTLYLFWFVAGVLVGNDPIVLSGTAFLSYFTRVTGIVAPTAWIFSQFQAANIASAALVTSNPTNVLIAGAFNLNFLTGFTAYTILPTAVTAIVAFPLLVAVFTICKPPSRDATGSLRSKQAYIPAELHPPDVAPRSALLDPKGAVFHSTLMIVTLATLVGTSFVHSVEVWMVTAPAAILAVLRDLWSERAVASKVSKSGDTSTYNGDIALNHVSTTPSPREASLNGASKPRVRWTVTSFMRGFTRRFPTTSATISRLPLSLLLFAGGVFVLARSLTSLGWTEIFASWLAKICKNPAITVFFLGYFTALVLCPLCGTNIGATILLVEIIRDSAFQNAPHVIADPRILRGAIYSTAMASNIGAFSWAACSSLAGLLWMSILRQKGIYVKSREFAGWNLLFLPILSTVSSAVVLLELYYFDI